jgi:hypothetical protein
MSEKRKPDVVMLMRPKHHKKSVKVELFRGTKWAGGPAGGYRIRCNGKFFPEPRQHYYNTYYDLDEVADILKKNLKQILD